VALPAFGHVHEGPFQVAGVALLVIDGAYGHVGPTLLALAGQEGALHTVHLSLLLELSDHPVANAGLRETGTQRVRNLVDHPIHAGITQNARHGRVGVQEAAARRHLENTLHGVLEQGPIPVQVGHGLLVPLNGFTLDHLDAIGKGQRQQDVLGHKTDLGRMAGESFKR